MLYGYLTVTGNQEGSEVCCLCGFVAEAEAWDSVERAWQALLAGIGGSFDAVACLHGTGPYQSWEVSHRRVILEALSNALTHSALLPVGSFVIQRDFWQLPSDARAALMAEDIDSPLDLVFSRLIERMICLVHEQSEKISLVVDREPESAKQYNELFNKHLGHYLLGSHLMGVLAFADAQGSMHLQTAKILGEAVLFLEKRRSVSQIEDASIYLPRSLEQLGRQISEQGRFNAARLNSFITRLKATNPGS